MQWYVFLIAMIAAAFLGQVAVELVGRPMRSAFRLRRNALRRMQSFETMRLPKPRELATSSQAIRDYDQAVRYVREAQAIFRDLGDQLIALSEREPAIRILTGLLGLNIVVAGHELINLSEIYAAATIDSDAMRHQLEKAHHATRTALAASPRRSRNSLIKIRIEPMNLRDAGYPRDRRRPLGRPPMVSRHARQKPRQFRPRMPEQTA